jgi:PEP-CTERM motif
MKKVLATLAIAALAGTAANAQYSFTSVGQTITESFTNYDGTAAPTNWTLNAVNQGNGAGQASFQGNRGDTGSTTGGWRSYGHTSPSNSSDRLLGFLGNGNYGVNTNGAFAMATASFVNNTGVTLNELLIGYTGEQWLGQSARESTFSVSYSLDGTTFTDVPSLLFTAPDTGEANNTVLDGEAAGNRVVFAPFDLTGLSIDPGNTFYIRWSYNGGGGAGSRQGLSLDDINVQTLGVVPEPTTISLFGIAAVGGLLMLRRSRRQS